MPFPPTFTNVWDTTFPPDTQLANLLGLDLRNFRVDVMQRMSLLSGVIANRPTPETVNATWGGAGYGLLYFSTDTSQVFQWNGAAWVDISNVFNNAATLKRYSDITTYTYTTVSNNVTTGVTIPAGLLVNGSQVEVEASFDVTAGATVTVSFQSAGLPIMTQTFSTGGVNRHYRMWSHWLVGASTPAGWGGFEMSTAVGAGDPAGTVYPSGGGSSPFSAGTGYLINTRYNITVVGPSTITQGSLLVKVFI